MYPMPADRCTLLAIPVLDKSHLIAVGAEILETALASRTHVQDFH
jgi:hypothetical protein